MKASILDLSAFGSCYLKDVGFSWIDIELLTLSPRMFEMLGRLNAPDSWLLTDLPMDEIFE
jgi:hypothetical protein